MIGAILKRLRIEGPRRHPGGRARAASPDAGFTLLELLVVLGILVMVMTLAAPQVLGYLGQARSQTAQIQLKNISTALELFYLQNGGYPTEQIGLSALVKAPSGLPNWNGPYLKSEEGLIDPWGHPYRYRVPGRRSKFEVYTFGRDNKEGGTGEDRDLASW